GRVPQKQGLKHDRDYPTPGQVFAPRASSTKTRIETGSCIQENERIFGSEGEFHKTRIETPMSPGRGSHVTDGKPHIVIRSR
ncbi:MAG: hypothetical protein NTY37_05190, partial [Methanothrix sp.]|nr:hypothetical protein [Methanothrix sp.]